MKSTLMYSNSLKGPYYAQLQAHYCLYCDKLTCFNVKQKALFFTKTYIILTGKETPQRA